MMGMTHVFAGTMAALTLTRPDSAQACLAALAGGALGAVACDVDLGRKSRGLDGDRSSRMSVGIALVCLAADVWLNTGLIRSIRTTAGETMTAGIFCTVLLLLWGGSQPHRGGTHSVLMVVLLGLCAKLICPPVAAPLMIGMGSHIALDLLNCRPVRLLYPLQCGVCLGMCKADGCIDRMIRTVCMLGTVFGLGHSLSRVL